MREDQNIHTEEPFKSVNEEIVHLSLQAAPLMDRVGRMMVDMGKLLQEEMFDFARDNDMPDVAESPRRRRSARSRGLPPGTELEDSSILEKIEYNCIVPLIN